VPEPEAVEVSFPDPPSPAPENVTTPTFSAEEQRAVEDQSQSIAPVISKPKRPRQSAKSQKTTEGIQTSIEDISNAGETTQIADSLEEE
jgi:hypothetical protein